MNTPTSGTNTAPIRNRNGSYAAMSKVSASTVDTSPTATARMRRSRRATRFWVDTAVEYTLANASSSSTTTSTSTASTPNGTASSAPTTSSPEVPYASSASTPSA